MHVSRWMYQLQTLKHRIWDEDISKILKSHISKIKWDKIDSFGLVICKEDQKTHELEK